MSSVSTHVLDAISGVPAANVTIVLTGADNAVLAEVHTDADGRSSDLSRVILKAGVYRLRFDTAAYFASISVSGFYPEVVIAFEIADDTASYHVPLLLSPYAYSTYRGS